MLRNEETKMKNTNKKIRNPFPTVGKIFKYEMISTSRIFLPMYVILLSLSLIIGLFVVTKNAEYSSNDFMAALKAIIIITTVIMFLILFVITISVIEKRFSKSILGDEGYLNLTLPVTIGEHLWGRYLSNLVWALSYGIIAIISVAICFIKEWGRIPSLLSHFNESYIYISDNFHMTFGTFLFMTFLNAIIFFMLLCVFSYMANSITKLAGKKQKLLSVLIFIVTFFLYTNIANLIFKLSSTNFEFYYMTSQVKIAIYNLVYTVIFSGITRFILTKKINLE